MSKFVLAAGLLSLAACSSELRRNVAAVGDGIADLQRDQVFRNLSRFTSNFHAIPSIFALGNGNIQVGNSFDLGTDPSISFRSIAITGVDIGGSNHANQSWDVAPVTGVSRIRLLQVLYQYAVTIPQLPPPSLPADHRTITTFEQLREQIGRLSPPILNEKNQVTANNLGDALNQIIGRLPDAPLMGSGNECGIPETRSVVNGQILCFLEKDDMDARAVQSRFILWATALTQDVRIAPPDEETQDSASRPSNRGSRSTRPTPSRLPQPGPLPSAPSSPRFSIERSFESLIPPSSSGSNLFFRRRAR